MEMEIVNINEFNDHELARRMRTCNYEKYKSLVRMHLSFYLDLNTAEFDLPCHEIVYEDKGKLKKWNRLSKKHRLGHAATSYTMSSSSVGCAAGAASNKSVGNSPMECLQQQIDAGFQMHLLELKQFLMLEKNLTQEGLFRKTGAVLRQNKLRLLIQQDKPLNLEQAGFSAHDCATVFKNVLAELPEPLLTDAHYPAHLLIAPLCQKLTERTQGTLERQQSLLNSVQLLLLLLPEEQRQLLQHIMEMLHAVALHEQANKMTAVNLAMVFTPHLICPRNLPPEVLHYTAKCMSSIVAYMIVRSLEIFAVPAKLSTDIRAYFEDRNRKKTMSPSQTLEGSSSDASPLNTVYSFVDRDASAAARSYINTDMEVAKLYSHVQALPESAKKRRLVKQFNKENGQGTPLLVVMDKLKNNEATRSAKSLGGSIKHIFHKSLFSRTPKREPALQAMTGSETPNLSHDSDACRVSPLSSRSEPNLCMRPQFDDYDEDATTANGFQQLFQSSVYRNLDLKTSTPALRMGRRSMSPIAMTGSETPNLSHDNDACRVSSLFSRSEPNLCMRPQFDDDDEDATTANGLQQLFQSSVYRNLDLKTSTPALRMGRRSMSPIAMTGSETPNLSHDNDACRVSPLSSRSEPNLCMRPQFDDDDEDATTANGFQQLFQSSVYRNLDLKTSTPALRMGRRSMSPIAMTGSETPNLSHDSICGASSSNSRSAPVSRQQLHELNAMPAAVPELDESDACWVASLSWRYKSQPNLCMRPQLDEDDEDATTANGFSFSTPETTKRMVRSVSATLNRRPSHQQLLQSSVYRNLITSTPALRMGRLSMSPITKSMQNLAMQESIMTPRSRKPVMLLNAFVNGDKQQNQSFAEQLEQDDELPSKTLEPPALHSEDATLPEPSLEGKLHNALTSDFNVLTASPADLSFASHLDDFGDTNTTKLIEDFDESEVNPHEEYAEETAL